MADYLDHSARWQNHRQPRDRRIDHTTPGFVRPPDPATGVNAGPPSDRDGAGDAPDEAKGVSTPAPVAVHEGDAGPCPAVVRCPDRIYCPPSCQQAGSREDPAHRPLTPADPEETS